MRCGLFVLGVGVALAVTSSAHAGDAVLPDEFDQPSAVSPCGAYGAGFAQLPGTKTCVKVSGQVRFEKRYSNRGSSTNGQTQLEFETRSD